MKPYDTSCNRAIPRFALAAWSTYFETLVSGDEKRDEVLAFGHRGVWPSKAQDARRRGTARV
jgi:hypothetical protein